MSSLIQELEAEIVEWDGRSKSGIEAIYRKWLDQPNFLDHLVKLIQSETMQVGATWLLKRGIESGAFDGESIADDVLGSLDRLSMTDAKLHVLQVMHRLPIPAMEKRNVERFLRDCLDASNKFVSTWAYSGFHALADRYPEYRDEVSELLKAGLRDGPASTRARIRKHLVQGEALTVRWSDREPA